MKLFVSFIFNKLYIFRQGWSVTVCRNETYTEVFAATFYFYVLCLSSLRYLINDGIMRFMRQTRNFSSLLIRWVLIFCSGFFLKVLFFRRLHFLLFTFTTREPQDLSRSSEINRNALKMQFNKMTNKIKSCELKTIL